MLTDRWLGVFVLMAIALGLQLALSSRQTLSFTRAVHAMRVYGQVAVGMGGGKWFGRRTFIALAAGPDGTVVHALRLRGITQFARPQPAPSYAGMTIAHLASEEVIPGMTASERAGARQAAQALVGAAGGQPAASGTPKGEERTFS